MHPSDVDTWPTNCADLREVGTAGTVDEKLLTLGNLDIPRRREIAWGYQMHICSLKRMKQNLPSQ